jgi:hypothetical protein
MTHTYIFTHKTRRTDLGNQYLRSLHKPLKTKPNPFPLVAALDLIEAPTLRDPIHILGKGKGELVEIVNAQSESQSHNLSPEVKCIRSAPHALPPIMQLEECGPVLSPRQHISRAFEVRMVHVHFYNVAVLMKESCSDVES